MLEYKAPWRDMQFVIHELLDTPTHYAALPGYESVGADTLDAILQEAARFAETVIAPLNQSGDAEGCHWTPEGVTTPTGFREAYARYVDGGWPGISAAEAYGGQGLPNSLGVFLNEMMGAANWAWSMYPGLSSAGVRCIGVYGSEDQKQTYMTRLVSGEWTGTMCLTEPHCGSDVGLLRTKAVPNSDGSYAISGTKIFISSGEHDLADNIVHMVLARIDGAPKGTKGVSLFIVPKFLPDANGNIGARNTVSCGALEKKMGVKASATCVMNFDAATGFLVGEANSGLHQMFTMMNVARLGTALQGMALAERAWQGAARYTRERLQMRSLSGKKNPDGEADPIIVHPDVRRLLLTQKAFIEGYRAFVYFIALQTDRVDRGDADTAKQADDLLALLTPIAKAFITETAFECTNHALQCYGGHGYIAENGIEQVVRDCRISMVWEGTTGIQAIDLIGRKVLGSGGELLKGFTKIVHQFCKTHADNTTLKPWLDELAAKNREWGELTLAIGGKAMENPDEVGAASVDYLMFSGYVVLGYFWARMALLAQQRLEAGSDETAFYQAKLETARFYFERLLPRTLVHAAGVKAGAANLMTLPAEHFVF